MNTAESAYQMEVNSIASVNSGSSAGHATNVSNCPAYIMMMYGRHD